MTDWQFEIETKWNALVAEANAIAARGVRTTRERARMGEITMELTALSEEAGASFREYLRTGKLVANNGGH